MQLLTCGNPKLAKGAAMGYATWGLHLAPHTLAGFTSVCPKSTAGCRASCLNTAGRGGMEMAQAARHVRTKLFFENRAGFLSLLELEIATAIRRSRAKGLTPVFRLNVTSDIVWEKYGIPQKFPDVQFYDYSKIPGRKPPPNYHITFSKSEDNARDVAREIEAGRNIAAVFDELPARYLDRLVIDGTWHDLRFLDPAGVIVGLTPKGRAAQDDSGFVIRLARRAA